MSDIKWTDRQQVAIDATGSSVLVSAGAGSGKTAVLTERCARLVSDADLACPVDRLLVVTFTEAAAAEMRERIAEALRKRLANSPNNRWLRQQLLLLDSAPISTIHSFCKRTLDRFFAHADLEPQAQVMDANDAAILRQQTAQAVFDKFTDRNDATGETFLDLLGSYGQTGDAQLIRKILALDSFLTSVIDPQAWIKQTLDSMAPPNSGHLPSIWKRRLAERLTDELAEQIAGITSTIDGLTGTMAGSRSAPPGVNASINCLQDYLHTLEDWLAKLTQNPTEQTLDEFSQDALLDYAFPAPPRETKTTKALPDAERLAFLSAKDAAKDARDTMFKKRLVEVFGKYSTADWANGITHTRPHAWMFLTLVTETRKAYQSAKRDLGVVDFTDLERMTLDLLRTEDNGVAARLRDQFQHVLVDEFQDVNPIQAEILRLVSREAEPHRRGNLFTVGDVKQSIYRFRLAEPQLFLQRHDDFLNPPENEQTQPGIAIDLVENFRSNHKVISVINAVFEKLMTPDLGGITYDEHARLVAGRNDASNDHGHNNKADDNSNNTDHNNPALELHVLDDLAAGNTHDDSQTEADNGHDLERIEREAYLIAQRIHALVQDGIPYGDIAILLRSMQTRAALFVRTLTRLGVPVSASTAGDFFSAIEVQDILSLLALLDNEQQDIPLASLLRSPLCGRPITDSELVEIRTNLPASKTGAPFHAAVKEYAKAGQNEALRILLTDVFQMLSNWRKRIRRRPLADILAEIYDQSGYPAYVAGLHEGEQRRANLLRLHEYARQFASFRRQGLHQFLRFLDDLRQADRALDTAPPPAPTDTDSAVQVMTIHRSKGLEFPIVIVAELGKRFNLQDARSDILFDRKLGLAMQAVDTSRHIRYPTLPHRLLAHANTLESLSEEMRILYVAMTRAEERLILVGSSKPSRVPSARQRYAGHSGVVPALIRRTATSPLDWVLAAICCQPREYVAFEDDTHPPANAMIRVTTHGPANFADWTINPQPRSGVAKRLATCASLLPLDDATITDFDQQAVVPIANRLLTPYQHAPFTRIPAAAAASTLKHHWNADLDNAENPSAIWPGESPSNMPGPAISLRQPDFLHETASTDPAGRGTLTHEFLQRLDLHGPCDEPDLKRQLGELSESGIIPKAQAAVINLADIAWFFSTDIGSSLRNKATQVKREWPFVLGVDPAHYDKTVVAQDEQDMMLVRGVVDVLFDPGTGWEILDYKTDSVTGDAIHTRAEGYRNQLSIYATAVEALWQQKVTRRWLVFLSPHEIIKV